MNGIIDYQFLKLIENVGCINNHGKTVYGTATLLRVLHCSIKDIKPEYIQIGQAYIQKYLST